MPLDRARSTYIRQSGQYNYVADSDFQGEYLVEFLRKDTPPLRGDRQTPPRKYGALSEPTPLHPRSAAPEIRPLGAMIQIALPTIPRHTWVIVPSFLNTP